MNEQANSTQQTNTILRPQMPELDAVRGLAILLVVFYHGLYSSFPAYRGSTLMRIAIAVTRFGWTGVDLFFVLSGFLISGILMDAKQRSRVKYYSSFYYRRALRILPLFYLYLLIVVFVALPHGDVKVGYLAFSVAYLANFAPYFGYGAHAAVSVIWSLAIEEQFYLFWPTAVRLCSIRAIYAICLSLLVLCPALRSLLFLASGGVEDGFSLTLTRLDGFAWGAVVAAVTRRSTNPRSQLKRFAAFGGTLGAGIIILGWPLGIGTRRSLIGASLQFTAFESLYAALIATVLVASTGPWKQYTAPAILRFFGKISYCLYLIHQLGFYIYDRNVRPMAVSDWTVSIRFLVVVLACCSLAVASYNWFEAPILRFKNLAWRSSRAEN